MTRIIIMALLLFSANARAGVLSVSTTSGESVQTRVSGNIVLNDKSTLKRTYYIVNDDKSPINLQDTGIRTYFYKNYAFATTGNISINTDISAFEVDFLLFDVFGQHLKTLEYVNVMDGKGGETVPLRGSWRASENDASVYLSSVAFLKSARRADGSVWTADLEKITRQISKLPFLPGEVSRSPE